MTHFLKIRDGSHYVNMPMAIWRLNLKHHNACLLSVMECMLKR